MPGTTHPPSGDYPQPARFHDLDLLAEADRLTQALPGHQQRSRNLARESGVSVVLMAMEAGDTLAEHSAPGVVTFQLLRGHVTLVVDGQDVDLREDRLVLLQPGVKHDARAEEQSVVLLTVTGGDD